MLTNTRRWVPAHSQHLFQTAGHENDIFSRTIEIPGLGLGDQVERRTHFNGHVLHQLSQYQDTNYLPLVNIHCECLKTELYTASSRAVKLSDFLKEESENTSSEDEDADDVTIEYLLQKLDLQRRKNAPESQKRALLNLVLSYRGRQVLQSEHFQKLIAYLHTDNITMKEAGLVLLQQCCSRDDNVRALITFGVLRDLEMIITSGACKPVLAVALDTLRKIMEHTSLKEMWWKPIQTLLPILLKKLANEKHVDIKVAVLKILKILSNLVDGAQWVTNEGMPVLAGMRDKNTDVKECFAEILTGLVCNGNPAEIGDLDNNGITVGLNLLQEGPCGPQIQSLKLISSLIQTSGGLTELLDNNVVPYIMSALQDSKCRKVKANACGVMAAILATRKPGKIKLILKQVCEYFDICQESNNQVNGGRFSSVSVGPQVIYPVKLQGESKGKLDQGMEKLVHLAGDLLCYEGSVQRGRLGQAVSVGLTPGVDTGTAKLSTLCSALGILKSVCCLAWNTHSHHKTYQERLNIVCALTESETERTTLSNVNSGLSLFVWKACGPCLLDLLKIYSTTFRSHTEKNSQKFKPPLVLSLQDVFNPNEIPLIAALLEVVLIFVFCSCDVIQNPGDKKFEMYKTQTDLVTIPLRPKSAKPDVMRRKSHHKLIQVDDSRQLSNKPIIIPLNKEVSEADQSEEVLHVGQSSSFKAHSPRRKDSSSRMMQFGSEENYRIRPGSGKKCQPSQTSLKKSEVDGKRCLLRQSLFEAGVFEAVTPLIYCKDVCYKVMVIQILRCLIQPLEKVESGDQGRQPLKYDHRKQRPQSAGWASERRSKHSVKVNLSPRVSLVLADVISEANQYKPLQLVARPNTPVSRPPSPVNQPPQIKEEDNVLFSRRTMTNTKLDPHQPITDQCRLSLLNAVGNGLLTGLFSPVHSVKRHTLLLLEDLVEYGDASFHMKLSEYGCMPKLVDFLRVNEDDELMEITALIVTRVLVTSDFRLREVFDKHGGSNLLMAMTKYTKGLLKKEVALTLKTVNKAKNDTRSAPAPSQLTIWEQINKRWQEEDKVAEILQQWNN